LSTQKAAFVIIDMQNFSCAPASGVPLPRINEVVLRINRLAGFCREKGIPVIWVRQNSTATGTGDNAGLYPLFHSKSHMESTMNRGAGTEIYPGMHVDHARDHVVFKNRYSAFLSDPPELREKVDSLGRTQLIVAGIAANVCVESTVRDAMQLDYEVVLVSDGTTAADDPLLESTFINTRLFFGDVRTTEDIVKELC
jgi:ureidoacrylate peracid hydrolase